MHLTNFLAAVLASTALAATVEDRASINFAEIKAVQHRVNGLRAFVQQIQQVTGDGSVRGVSGQLHFGDSLTKLNKAAAQAQGAINTINGVVGKALSQYEQNEQHASGRWN